MQQCEVTHVITTINRGGAELQLLLLTEAQLKLGHKITIMPLKGESELKNNFEKIGATVDSTLCNKNTISQIFLLKKKLTKSNGILHCHLPRAELLVSVFVRKKMVSVCTRHFGDTFIPGGNRVISRLLSNMSARYFDRVIAISASVKDFLIYSGEIRESSKISIINYGFNPGRFALSADSQGVSEKLKGLLENAQNSVLIGMVSRLDKEKRIDLALSAVSELVKTNPNIKLIIVGEGRLRGELEDQVRSLNLEDYVFLVGKQESIAYFMQRIDIFLHTSFFEGFGMVFLEAMAMNLPIIAYKSAGAVEVLGLNGAATFFVTPGDLVRRLKEYDPRIKTLSSSQQDLKLQQYLISETANKTEIVYQEISN